MQMAGYICRRCAYTPRITRLFDDVEDMPGDEINQFVIEHMDNNNVRYGEDAFEGSVVYRMVYCNNCNIRLGRYFVLIPREAEDEMFEYLMSLIIHNHVHMVHAVQENGFHYPVPNLIQVPDGKIYIYLYI
ncbi:hypothetical protein ACJIZ3_007282 [Penstemon smallii]|uniref:Protein yippee-like n=1 Tax=Penstemon smallii TaxID=265156 RepID=A0ABD3SAK2_9LAMI